MIHMPNDDTPWPLPNDDEESRYHAGGIGQYAAIVLYARRVKCSEGPAAYFLRWYFADIAGIRASYV